MYALINLANTAVQWLVKTSTPKRPSNALGIEEPQPYRLVGLRFWWRPAHAFPAQLKHPNYEWWKAPYWLISWIICFCCTVYLFDEVITYNYSSVFIALSEQYRMTGSYCFITVPFTENFHFKGDCPVYSQCGSYQNNSGLGGPPYKLCLRTGIARSASLLYYVLALCYLFSKISFVARYFPHFGAFAQKFLLANKTTNVLLKREFRSVVVQASSGVAIAHSHPKAAAARNGADNALNHFIRLQGFRPYSIQLSNRDILSDIEGSLIHYHHQDQHIAERSDAIHPDHVFKLVNVDYYIDWVQYLWMGMPFFLYTFTPEDPCGTESEYRWTTNIDNTITMQHSGAEYRHQLWSYNVDHVVASYPGINITYDVEVNRISKNWSLVAIIPKTAVAASAFQQSSCTFKRQQLVVRSTTIATLMEAEKYNEKKLMKVSALVVPCAVIEHTAPSGTISIGRIGQYCSLQMKPELRATIDARIEVKQLSIADLSNLLSVDYGNMMRFASAMVHTCYPYNSRTSSQPSTKYEKRDLAVSYGKVDASFLPEKCLTGLVLSNPIIDSGFIPWRSKPNEVWTRSERIENVRNPQCALNDKFLQYATEFVRLLIKDEHSLTPLEVSQVMVLQNRPSQVLNNKLAETNLATWMEKFNSQVKSFQKSEVYPAPKDPRNISTLPSEHCLLYSTFTLPFADLLKKTDWYVFGLHPDRVAEKVHALCSKATTIVETDFSRFDGTHSFALYKLELAMLLRAFPPMWHEMITRVHKSMTSSNARMALGTMYSIGGSRLSGSADTSCMNSVDNAYLSYTGYRDMGYAPAAAYEMLGLYGGDDGLSRDIETTILNGNASQLGLSLKSISRLSHLPTSLLGRRYPRPHSSPSHMADLPRQLAKLHICPTRDPRIALNPWIGIYNKASGYIATDRHTPILGVWCRTAIRLAPSSARQEMLDLQQYTVRMWTHEQSQYAPTREAAMEQATIDLDLSAAEIELYELLIEECETCEDFVHLPCIKTYLGKIPDNVQLGTTFGNIVEDVKVDVPKVEDPGDAQVDRILAGRLNALDTSLTCGVAIATPIIGETKREESPIGLPASKPPSPLACTNGKEVCKTCNISFENTEKDKIFYKKKNLQLPKRCKACRKRSKLGKTKT